MMRISRIEHGPMRVLFNYFERAGEELGFKAWAILLIPGNEQYFQRRIENQVYWTLEHRRWEQEREEILSNPEKHLRWESREDPEEEILGHYRLQAAIVATLMGDGFESRNFDGQNADRGKRYSKRKYERAGKGLRTLAAQLIVEHTNRKLEISYFLGNLTGGQVGVVYPELPTKSQVLQRVSELGRSS
jgi:hypothetical protein